jgi:hypothetical protein
MTEHHHVGGEEGREGAALARAALAVLDRNWLGAATRPGALYPHQWSWDAAAIAMGRAAWDQERSEAELRSLFAAQWRNGMVPQIVFSDAGGYFPGPDFWQAERSPDAPDGIATSGIVQPPIHAIAAWRAYLHSPDKDRAAAFLRELYPKLAAWHGYLHRERTRDGALVEVWHPWETGMDNSPAWDGPLARIDLAPAQVPRYRRVDVTLTDPAQRPSDAEYDRYAYLVGLFRDAGYDPARIRDATPFAVRSVLFNALLIESDRALAGIARIAGADPARHEASAGATAAAMEALWDPGRGAYVDYDVRAGSPVDAVTVATYAPLYAGVPAPARAEALLDTLMRSRAPLGESTCAVPSLPLDDPRFQPALYWRGPVWPVYQWIVHHGAARYGHHDVARRARDTLFQLARDDGLWEHYHPLTGAGQGIETFAWTAGFVLDLLAGPAAGVDGP